MARRRSSPRWGTFAKSVGGFGSMELLPPRLAQCWPRLGKRFTAVHRSDSNPVNNHIGQSHLRGEFHVAIGNTVGRLGRLLCVAGSHPEHGDSCLGRSNLRAFASHVGCTCAGSTGNQLCGIYFAVRAAFGGSHVYSRLNEKARGRHGIAFWLAPRICSNAVAHFADLCDFGTCLYPPNQRSSDQNGNYI